METIYSSIKNICLFKGYSKIKIPIMCVLLGCWSCDTEIPEVDEESPGFTFSVSGPDGGQQFTSSSDFETGELKLTAGTTYDFAYIATDEGGVSSAEFMISPFDIFELDDLNPALVIDQTSGLSRTITLTGELSDPQTALTLSGKLLVKPMDEDFLSADFRFKVRDFGGVAGDINTTDRILNVTINQPE